MRHVFVLLTMLIVTGMVTAAELDEAGAIAVLQKLDASKATDAELFDAAAACRRLTVIGTEKSVAVLEPLLADPKLDSYARTALENIKKPEAEAALRRHPAKTDNASPVSEKLAATRKQVETIAAGGPEADAIFVKLLKSDDKTEFNAALEAFRKKPNVALLAKEQVTLKPDRRVAAILSLLDLKDVKPLPVEIVEAAKSDENAEVQAAAIAVLGKFPDEKTADFFIELLTKEADETISEILASTKAPGFNDKLIEALESPNVQLRTTAGLYIGGRRVTEARSRLWEIQKDKDGPEASFLLTAFGQIADEGGFHKLLGVFDENSTSRMLGAFAGLRDYCKSCDDRNKHAKFIAQKVHIETLRLGLLADLGGDEALKQIAEIARKTDKDEVRDQATKILGEWTGAEVAPVLLELSASLSEEKYKVRTLRGFLRAVRQFEMPKDEKKKLCEKALEIASREEEKKLVRDVMSKL